MTGPPVFEVRDLRKHFRQPGREHYVTRAIDGLDLEVREGETVAVVGESGSGKTTLARVLLALEEPTGGEVLFHGRDLGRLEGRDFRTYRREVQAVFQNPFSSLNPRMRVGSIISEPMRAQGLARGRELRERVAGLLTRVGLAAEDADRLPRSFSGGQRQRIAIARALSTQPRTIILDEPTSALDVSIRAQILNLLKDLQSEFGLTYVFISHDLATVRYLADRVAVLYAGRLMETGEADQIFQAPSHPYTRALLASVPVPDPDVPWLANVAKDEAATEPAQEGCPFRPRCPHAFDPCGEMPPLFEVEPRHTAACFLHAGEPARDPVASTRAGGEGEAGG